MRVAIDQVTELIERAARLEDEVATLERQADEMKQKVDKLSSAYRKFWDWTKTQLHQPLWGALENIGQLQGRVERIESRVTEITERIGSIEERLKTSLQTQNERWARVLTVLENAGLQSQLLTEDDYRRAGIEALELLGQQQRLDLSDAATSLVRLVETLSEWKEGVQTALDKAKSWGLEKFCGGALDELAKGLESGERSIAVESGKALPGNVLFSISSPDWQGFGGGQEKEVLEALSKQAEEIGKRGRGILVQWLSEAYRRLYEAHASAEAEGVRLQRRLPDWFMEDCLGMGEESRIAPREGDLFDHHRHALEDGMTGPDAGQWKVTKTIRSGYQWSNSVVVKAIVEVEGEHAVQGAERETEENP